MIILNNGQEYVTNKAVEWFKDKNNLLFEYSGIPGAGKSVVLMEIIRRLNLDILTGIAAMSFTGTASLVMRMKGFLNAKTAHSWIYRVEAVPMKDSSGNVVYDELLNVPIMIPKFRLINKLDDNIELIVIDEGYCLPKSVGDHIKRFNKKILVCGDQNQLPPVNDEPAFLTNNNIYRLTECMRQAGKEDISFIANRAGMLLPLLNGYYGNSMVINRPELTDSMLLWADIIICGTNYTRDNINKRIRSLKGYTSELPQYGEKVVARSNNWLESVSLSNGTEINITNGLVCKVLSNPDVSTYDGELFSMTLAPELAPNAIFFNTRCNYKHMISDHKIRDNIRKNKYSKGNMFEFAYAITTYLAQGGQWHKVIYIEENMKSNQGRMNLVGASRADMSLIYVKM
jgi:exodeoxyribonuclease-5